MARKTRRKVLQRLWNISPAPGPALLKDISLESVTPAFRALAHGLWADPIRSPRPPAVNMGHMAHMLTAQARCGPPDHLRRAVAGPRCVRPPLPNVQPEHGCWADPGLPGGVTAVPT